MDASDAVLGLLGVTLLSSLGAMWYAVAEQHEREETLYNRFRTETAVLRTFNPHTCATSFCQLALKEASHRRFPTFGFRTRCEKTYGAGGCLSRDDVMIIPMMVGGTLMTTVIPDEDFVPIPRGIAVLNGDPATAVPVFRNTAGDYVLKSGQKVPAPTP